MKQSMKISLADAGAPGHCRIAGAVPSFLGMEWIPGGSYMMGSDQHYPEEAPAHRVIVDGF
jgi:formylglycine-generating enzyme required for sulfatase activity